MAQESASDLERRLALAQRELSETREQQAATAEVLGIIASSPGELEPVFQAILANATRICEAKFGTLFKFDGEGLVFEAGLGMPQRLADYLKQRQKFKPLAGSTMERLVETRQVVHVHDVTQADGLASPSAMLGGARTYLGVPMLKENKLVGAIVIYRQEVRPFVPKQIELVTNFATQAVIAIENARLLNELRQRTDDLSEALEQQTATSEVLRVISSSPGDLVPVFETILALATRICEAKFGSLYLYDGKNYRTAAQHNPPPALAELRRQKPVFRAGPGTGLGRAAAAKQVVHIADLSAEQAYIDRDPLRVDGVELIGARTALFVPMLKENTVIGTMTIFRQQVRPFTDKQIELVSNFAQQAVIAIENTRLLNELRESLQQQTATSEVLQVISSSPGELEPAFHVMLENATRLCEAKFGTMVLREGDAFRSVAMHNAPPAFIEERQRNPLLRPNSTSGIGRVIATRQVLHIADVREDRGYLDGAPGLVALADTAGARSLVVVPLLKDDGVVGTIAIFRQEVRPFTDKQIELVQNFAAQAVIAIENTRLLNELRELLEQQTATSKVLSVISSSPGDLEPVFQAMLENATRICDAKFGFLFRYDDGAFQPMAMLNVPSALADFMRQRGPYRPEPGLPLHRLLQTKKAVHTIDQATEKVQTPSAKLAGARSHISVPMLKEGEIVGAVSIYRQEVRPFTDKQIELLTNFASQAVIAIENTRLLNELRESLQQQTATADVLKVISRSTFDLQVVLQTLVESAAHLCDADKATITRQKDGVFFRAEAYGFSREFIDYVRDVPVKPERGTVTGRALLEGKIIHIADVLADPDYSWSEAQRLGGFRTILGVPMLREGIPIGVLALTRDDVRPFTQKQIELVSTFADQAAIAIENVRLFDEIQEKNRQLAEASQHKSQFVSSMSHELRTPLNAIIGLTEMMVTNASRFGTEKAQEPLQRVNRAGTHLLGLINQVLDLSKIEAGKLDLNPQTVQLAPLIEEVIGTARQLAEQNKNRLILERAGEPRRSDG